MALVRTSPPSRDGNAAYELSITSDATGIALLRLVTSDPAGTLQVTGPARTVVTPGATVILEVSVAPRIRRTSGPERQLSFAISAYDENTGQAAGSATGEYLDFPAKGGMGYGRLLTFGLLGGLVVAAAAGGGFALLNRDNGDGVGGDLTGEPPERSIRPGTYDYNFTVEENTCSFGARPGEGFSLSFRFANTGSGFIEDRDQVMVTFLGSNGREARVGRATFDFDAFEFSYNPAKAGDVQGRAKVETAFADAETIGAARYTETYDLGSDECVITATQ